MHIAGSDTVGAKHGGSGQPTVALALGGGGARGLAHIHVVEVLDELGIRPVAVAGSSIGAIIGAAMCAGLKGATLREHVTHAFVNRPQMMSRLWKLRPATLGGIARQGFRIGQLDIQRAMEAFLPVLPMDLADLDIPLTVVATDFYANEEVHITEGALGSALAASGCIPGIFRPIRREGRVLIDANITNPCPFDLVEGKADIVIAVDVVGAPTGDPSRLPPTIECLIGANQIMMRAMIEDKMRLHAPDILVRSRPAPIRALDFHRARDILAWSAHLRDDLRAALARHGVGTVAA